MFVMVKKVEELFASTLNRIAASVRHVSSMTVVVIARLVAAHANKKDGGKRRNPTKVPFLLIGTHEPLSQS